MSQNITPVAPHSTSPGEVEEFRAPPHAGELGMWIAVLSIGMLFAAGLIGYALARSRVELAIDLPLVFWLSTALLNVSSATLYYAMLSDRAAHATAARRAVGATGLLGSIFLILQIPALQQLIEAHDESLRQGAALYGIVVILVGLHATHVLVGLVAMIVLARRLAQQTDPERRSESIQCVSIYWHGLTVIWIAMFSVLQAMN